MKDFKTVYVESYGIRLVEESESKFETVRIAAEKLAEAILASKYPMIPNQTYDHTWSGSALQSSINCPTVFHYLEDGK